jgi:prepilin-type N-terminal cleavage/methylation domain-containing protein
MKTVKQSFTLVEILVVIVIIGILSSFIFFTINDSVEKANTAKSKMFSESIRNNLLLNLVSEWKFDNGSGAMTANAVVDTWGSYNAISIAGGPQFKGEVECVSGTCIEFDGGTDHINFGTSLPNIGNNDFTVSVWVKLTRDSAYRAILSKGLTSTTDFLLYKTNGEILRLYCDNSNLVLDITDWTNDQWINFVVFRKGSIAKAYMDGKYKVTDTTATANLTNSHSWIVGAAEDGSQRFFDGLIDEVQIYNAAISETAIKQNYLLGLNNLYAKGLITELEYNEKLSEL